MKKLSATDRHAALGAHQLHGVNGGARPHRLLATVPRRNQTAWVERVASWRFEL